MDDRNMIDIFQNGLPATNTNYSPAPQLPINMPVIPQQVYNGLSRSTKREIRDREEAAINEAHLAEMRYQLDEHDARLDHMRTENRMTRLTSNYLLALRLSQGNEFLLTAFADIMRDEGQRERERFNNRPTNGQG